MPPEKRAVLVIFGASGAGKTTAVRRLESRQRPRVRCFYFDSIGVPSVAMMTRDYGSPEAWQAEATRSWLARLAVELAPGEVGVLDGQTRPSFVRAAAAPYPDLVVGVCLFDCTPEVRAARLMERGQADLHTSQMNAWAIYLRGQADALELAVIDTSHMSVEQAADQLEAAVAGLQTFTAAHGLSFVEEK